MVQSCVAGRIHWCRLHRLLVTYILNVWNCNTLIIFRKTDYAGAALTPQHPYTPKPPSLPASQPPQPPSLPSLLQASPASKPPQPPPSLPSLQASPASQPPSLPSLPSLPASKPPQPPSLPTGGPYSLPRSLPSLPLLLQLDAGDNTMPNIRRRLAKAMLPQINAQLLAVGDGFCKRRHFHAVLISLGPHPLRHRFV